MGITNGFSVNISQACGEQDLSKLKEIIASSIKISAVFGVLFSAVGLLLLKPILQIIQTDDELLNDCLTYGYIIFSGLLITVAYNLLSSILRGMGDSRTPLFAIGVSSALKHNIGFIIDFLFKFGVSGPAYATIVSQLISVVICYFRLHRMNELKINKRDFIFNFRLVTPLYNFWKK